MIPPNERRGIVLAMHPEARMLTPQHDFLLNPNRGLPSGARKSVDPVVNGILRDDWTEELRWDEEASHRLSDDLEVMRALLKPLGYRVAASDLHAHVFNGEEHPTVEGYRWNMGYRFSTRYGKGEVFIFSGFKQLSVKGGAPDPIIYAKGEVTEDIIREVAEKYHEVRALIRRRNYVTA